jgi:hypothetical protein
MVGERCVKRIGFHSKLFNPVSRTHNHVIIMVVEMHGIGTNLNYVEAASTDCLQTVKDALLVKTTRGEADRPIAHTSSDLKGTA